MEKQRTIPSQVEVRCIATDLHIECREQVEGRTITGYAAKFECWSEQIAGWFKEKIARSAFEGCNLQDVIMCFNHNVDDILARTTSGTLKLSVDDTGLRFEFDAPNTTRGNDMLELVRRGDVDKCSFKFIVEKDEWRYADDKNQLDYDERTILKFALLKDVALVVFPAYKDTEASARHLEERKVEYLKTQEPQPQSEPPKTSHRTRTSQFTQLKNSKMAKLKTLKEKRASIYTQIDELRKTADGRDMTAEEQQRWDTLLSDYEKSDKQVETEERFQDVERRQTEQAYENRQQGGEPKDGETEYRSAFSDYLMLGANGVSAESRQLFEKRAGITGLNGGVIVPKSLASSIEVALKAYGGMFEAGTIITTDGGGDLIMPTINDTTSKAAIVTEYQQSTKKAPSFGSETLKAYTYRTPIVPISQELLQDSAFDLESLLGGLLAESFGRGINEDLTIGNGTGKPRGIITCATASDAAPSATAIKLDDIIDLMKSVDSAYGRNGRFMFNRDTLWNLVKIKDTTGRYIWQEGAKDGTPATLFGRTYILNDDVPSIGAGNASVLFGDFSKYKIRMVRNFRVIRLNELLAEYLSIGLFGFARVDGVLLDAGTYPVKKLVHATT